MAKTWGAGQRHAQAWIDFFEGAAYMTREAVEMLITHRKRNKYFQQSLKRLIANGIISERKDKFSVTPKGILYFLRKRRHSGALGKRKKKWDGKWRLVSFDVPVYDNGKRHFLRGLLREFGFYKLQGSVWVCPNHLAEHFWKLVVHYELERYCKVMLVEVLEGDEELRKHFKLL